MYICKYCGDVFTKSNLLASHTSKYHRHTKPEYVRCPHCNRVLRKGHYGTRKHIECCAKKHVEYRCEICGKVVKTLYGSGRFCGSFCAHSRIMSNATKEKLRDAVRRNGFSGAIIKQQQRTTKSKCSKYFFILKYIKNPQFCKVCGKRIPFKNHYKHKTCGSKECLYSINKLNGGYKKHSRNGNAGYYKGIYCDSTYELMFLIWCLDHDVPIVRNKIGYDYEYEGKHHLYYPDFILNNRMLIEIKNYPSELTDKKVNAVPKPIKILYGKDLLNIAKYVAAKYNKTYRLNGHKLYNNFKDLYDK